jgi:hypothetical protein
MIVGGLNPTTYGAVEDDPRDEEVDAGAGIIPCVRKCLLALDRTANLRLQPGNVQGYAVTRQHERTRQAEVCILTSNIIMDIHVRPKSAWSILENHKYSISLHAFVCSPGKFLMTYLAIVHFRFFLLRNSYWRRNGVLR